MMKNNHLALGGLFAALHLLFLFLSKMLVGSELILVIFLPLLSTIYSLKFNIKESAMFFIATFFLCAIFEPISTFIYILPSLLCGTVYGIARKKEVKELSLIYISSFAHFLSVTISFLFITMMFKEVDIFKIFSTFINKDGQEFYVCVYLVLILLGIIEAFSTHIISNEELKKIGYAHIESELSTPLWINLCLIVSVITYVVLGFINPILSCYCLPFLIAFTIPNVVDFIVFNKRKWIYFIVGIMFFASLFVLRYLNGVFYPVMLMIIISPLVVDNFIRVLYTNSIKYSNKD